MPRNRIEKSTIMTIAPKQSNTYDQKDNKQRLLIIAAVVIGVLLLVNAGLLYSYLQKAKLSEQLAEDNAELNEVKASLEKEYDQAMTDLEGLRSDNQELNDLISRQQAELGQQKARIEELLRNKGNLDRARAEVRRLGTLVEQYLAEITQLREQNQLLASQNEQLTAQQRTLQEDLYRERQYNSEITSNRDLLQSQRDELANVRDAQAALVNVYDVEVVGKLQRRQGRRAVLRHNADNINQLEVCFKMRTNDLAGRGEEEFLLRILNPQGETLAVDEAGSGYFTNLATGRQTRYTMKKSATYNPLSASPVCMTWTSAQPFSQGDYIVEIYNKGLLAGQGKLNLR